MLRGVPTRGKGARRVQCPQARTVPRAAAPNHLVCPVKGDRGGGGDALEGKRPQRWPQRRLGRRLEEVAKAVGGGYCRLQMPLKLASSSQITHCARRGPQSQLRLTLDTSQLPNKAPP